MNPNMPDYYQFIRITSPHDTSSITKLFCVWTGGYTQGDSWKFNSGVSEVEKAEHGWNIYGYSGSCYTVFAEGEGNMNAYGSSVLQSIISKAEAGGVSVELVSLGRVIDEYCDTKVKYGVEIVDRPKITPIKKLDFSGTTKGFNSEVFKKLSDM